MSKPLSIVWKDRCRRRALKTTADKYHIKISEVKALVELASEYMKDTLKNIDVNKDLTKEYTRFQKPMLGGFFAIKKMHIYRNMYEYGHISERQWKKLNSGYRAERLKELDRKIELHNNYLKNLNEKNRETIKES